MLLSCLAVIAPSLFAETNDVVNERPLLRASDLESHWQVDCEESMQRIEESNAWDINADRNELSRLESVLRRCGYIYNLAGTARYVECPDYMALADQLKRLLDHSGDAGGSRPGLRFDNSVLGSQCP